MEWMVFITHVLKKFSGCWLLLCLGLPGTAVADEFVVRSASTRLHGEVYMLDANIALEFGEKPLEALHNGIPLTLLIEIEVERKRTWWLDEGIAFLEQRYQIKYHALSHQYLLTNLNSGERVVFPRLEPLLITIGTIHNFPLLDKNLTEHEGRYEVGLRALLDIEALPAPLRPLAYITPSWRIRSDWHSWFLTP
jgi:hypothetical protein